MPIFDTVLHWLRPTDQEGSTEELITELTTSNIAIQSPSPDHHAQWITPRYHSESAPFLRGVMRTYLLFRGELREEDITVQRFKQLVAEGRRVVGINGLR
jgi:branched-subunit amino acid aminotransferase/4-amino-4-deoxychorismate lyase